MPPQQKHNKESVLEAAFELVREQGIENLNARSLARRLNSSIRPIFSYYENMAELRTDLFAMVGSYQCHFFDRVEAGEKLFLNIGMAYIDFALEEPNLFRMLFMSHGFSGRKLTTFFDDASQDGSEYIAKSIAEQYDADTPELKRMFTDIWLYAHGIASLLVANQLPTPRSEIEAMLDNVYSMLMNQIKGEK